jgi:hypothetical protein
LSVVFTREIQAAIGPDGTGVLVGFLVGDFVGVGLALGLTVGDAEALGDSVVGVAVTESVGAGEPANG